MSMNEIDVDEIIDVVARLCIDANCDLGEDVMAALKEALENEESPIGREVLEQLLENARIAREERMPICQDTGLTVVFLEVGKDVRIVGGDLYDAVNEGVHRGYREGYLRKSVVGDPMIRENTNDNTPAVVYVDVVPDDKLKIKVLPKGAGGENVSAIKMLTPAEGVKCVKDFVLQVVESAGGKPCPPIIVGVGIGGDFEYVALLSKRALLRPIGIHNPQKHIEVLEKELLAKINDLGIGPQGFGGRVTALAVNIETFACHIGSLPVAVNINCYAHRYKEAALG